MTDDERARRAAPFLAALAQIPMMDRDAKRLPLIGRILGAGVRAAGHVASLRADLESAYLGGTPKEELERRIGEVRELAEGEIRELRAALDSWPEREPPRRRVVAVKLLPRTPKAAR